MELLKQYMILKNCYVKNVNICSFVRDHLGSQAAVPEHTSTIFEVPCGRTKRTIKVKPQALS